MTDLISKLNRIFEGILDCRFEFQPREKLSTELWSREDLALLDGTITEPPRYIESFRSGCFGFPVNINGAFAGLAIVNGFHGADPTKLLMLAELFTLLFESGLRLQDRKEQLRSIEERLRLLEESSNVIPLHRSSRARHQRHLQVIETPAPVPAAAIPLVSKPLLIEIREDFPLHKIAIEIHQLSGRWAFISVNDLPEDIFSSKENLQQLGAVTLYIPQLAHLTTNQQLKLAEYLASEPTEDMPQIIAGTDESANSLKESKRVLEHLLDLFFVSNLQWAPKTREEVTSDLINASLRHLLEHANDLKESHQIGDNFIPFHIQYFDPDHPTMH